MAKSLIALAVLLAGLVLAPVLRGSDKPNEGTWQLPDNSDFKATLDPWPAKQGGQVTIHASADENDNQQKFKGTVEYRVVTQEKSTAPWLAMKPAPAKVKGNVDFEVTATLPQAAKVYVQFKIKQAADPKPTELTDWSIELEK
jgi:hypothetical protein